MLVRRLIGVLAVSGVLLHVGALVHHNAVMVEAQFQHNALLADLGRICHGGGEAGTVGSAPWCVALRRAMPAERHAGATLGDLQLALNVIDTLTPR